MLQSESGLIQLAMILTPHLPSLIQKYLISISKMTSISVLNM